MNMIKLKYMYTWTFAYVKICLEVEKELSIW